MNNKRQPEQPAESFNIGDIYFVLFRQKWIILSFFAVGLLGAVAVWFLKPAQYESEAKLYVQYVMEVATPSSQNSEEYVHTTSSGASELIHTEIEFLTSQDLAYEVVDKVGADKILAKLGGGSNTNRAASVILKNLVPESVVTTPSVIRITFQHPDQDVARDVLFNIVQAYVNKSAEEHRPVQVSDDFLVKGTEHLRLDLNKTETELNNAKKEAGVVSTLEETKKNWNNQINELTSQIHLAGSDLAARSASQPPVKSTSTNNSTNTLTIVTEQNIPALDLENYKALSAALTQMYDKHVEGITHYPAGSLFLKDIEDQITNLSQRKQALEDKYPGLTSISVQPVPSPNHPEATAADPATDAQAVKSLTAKIAYLNSELEKIKQLQAKLEAKEPEILELQVREVTQTEQLKTYSDKMQQLQLAGNQPNSGGIKPIESPTPAVKKHSKTFKKLMMMTLAGGAFGGLAVAFLIEMVLDRSVKRPDEIEKKLKLPLFISIPDTNHNGHRRQAIALAANNRLLLKEGNGEALVRAGNGKGKGKSNGTDSKGLPEELAPWDRSNVLHRFYAGLRDRLIVNFEVRNLNHNPKLVAVTSCRRGAGVSSIAAGLAASLSETGDGNVLLVDMRAAQGAAQQFHKGKPVSGVDTDLGSEINGSMFGRDNSSEESEGSVDGDIPRVLSKKFATMMPKLKASDYDYIIFDMPPVSQTSMTPRLAGLMDMVLLVIESEKTNRDAVQRATALLSESKAQISTVLNKVRTYVPTRLHQEFLDDEA